ncbi:MAG: hypothetical protein IPI48_03730 [bacterium]|nr:hypothetical protein [bacterium]
MVFLVDDLVQHVADDGMGPLAIAHIAKGRAHRECCGMAGQPDAFLLVGQHDVARLADAQFLDRIAVANREHRHRAEQDRQRRDDDVHASLDRET